MGLSGLVGAGAIDALDELTEQLLRQQMADEAERRSQAAEALGHRRIDEDIADRAERGRQFDASLKARTDESAADRREVGNERGLKLMRQDKDDMDTESAISSLPPHLKALGPLLRIGGVRALSPDDAMDPAARRSRELHELTEDAEARAKAAAKYREPDRGRRSIQQAVAPDGSVTFVSVDLDTGQATPVQLPPGMQANKPPKPITGAERSALSFFNRMVDAERNARGVEDKLTGVDLGAAEMAPDFIENWLRTPQGQAYAQAQRQFTEARLRKESGAAVPPGEYENDRRTNFRIAGDKPETVKQKRGSRLQTMRGIGNMAARALQEHYGPDATLESILAEFAEQEAVQPPPDAAKVDPLGIRKR